MEIKKQTGYICNGRLYDTLEALRDGETRELSINMREQLRSLGDPENRTVGNTFSNDVEYIIGKNVREAAKIINDWVYYLDELGKAIEEIEE